MISEMVLWGIACAFVVLFTNAVFLTLLFVIGDLVFDILNDSNERVFEGTIGLYYL